MISLITIIPHITLITRYNDNIDKFIIPIILIESEINIDSYCYCS